jgi:hypothetical protein
MRVSKVKVSVDDRNEEMVRMNRTHDEGMLIYPAYQYPNADTKPISRTSEILPGKKQGSFDLSIQNKTLRKPKSLSDEHKELMSLICDWSKLRKLTIDRLRKDFLTKQFKETYKYNDGKQEISFDLAELIIEAINSKSITPMQPYYDWKKWYIKTKSDELIKSIDKNRIPLDNDASDKLSPRRLALRRWSEEMTANTGDDKNKIDLTNCQNKFGVDSLIRSLNDTQKPEQKTDNKTKLPKLDKGGNPEYKMTEFHCRLKKVLQEHQKKLFGTSTEPKNRKDEKLYVYSTEVTKYLEHYFPVKKGAKRRNSPDDITHYLKAETIKRIVEHQIVNAVRADQRQMGKFEHHECANDTIDSATLSCIKADEAFAMHLAGMCAFAANNIRNIVDKTQENDILGQGDFSKSIAKNKKENNDKFVADRDLLRFFYDIDTLTETDTDVMRQAVAYIRNQIVHYRKEALTKIFSIGVEDCCCANTIFKQCLTDDITKLPECLAEQLMTSGVLTYYKTEDLKGLLSTGRFSLLRSVVPFAPGFKNVMTTGRNHQHKEKSESYDLDLKCYMKQKSKYSDADAYEARYFLMKLIYNNMFLPTFTRDTSLFKASVDDIRKHNKDNAQKGGKAWAFKEVPEMKNGDSVEDYMRSVQSLWMLEENKKEVDTQKGEGKENRHNFSRFLLQVFAKGLDTYMRDEKFSFVKNENIQQGKLEDLKAEILPTCKEALNSSEIDPTNNSQIAFYTFCKLLDANHLSSLRNELIKYSSAAKSGKDNIGEQKANTLQAIIELCMMSADRVKLSENNQNDIAEYESYIEKGVDYKSWDIYTQQDNDTPVIHSNMELSKCYGTAELLKRLVDSNPEFRITKKDNKEWTGKREDIKRKTTRRTELHEQWVKSKSDKNKKLTDKEREEYQCLCKSIDRYDWIYGKLKFEHLRRLQALTIEILGRLSGFVTMWERDFRYFDQKVKLNGEVVFKENKGLPKGEKYEIYIGSFLPKDDIIGIKRYVKKGKEKEEKENICLSREIRNHIAHFNYLTKAADGYSIMDLVNNLRRMMFYDRKLKNAVTKALIKLFDKHGMELKLKCDTNVKPDVISVESIEPKKIYHLGTTGKKDKEGKSVEITTNQVPQAYCNMCKALLELKK